VCMLLDLRDLCDEHQPISRVGAHTSTCVESSSLRSCCGKQLYYGASVCPPGTLRPVLHPTAAFSCIVPAPCSMSVDLSQNHKQASAPFMMRQWETAVATRELTSPPELLSSSTSTRASRLSTHFTHDVNERAGERSREKKDPLEKKMARLKK
jgi:hypothetical protein